MAVSQNGWSVINSAGLDKRAFAGSNIVPVPGVRAGNVAVVLNFVGAEFNRKVEALVNPGCWGYSYRVIGNTNIFSNHSSGTAIDLNAPRHPQGRRGTFSAPQVAQIRGILNYLEGTVRWGGDYTTTVDEMHFEINTNAANVDRIAAKLQGGGEEMIATVDQADKIYRMLRPNGAASAGEIAGTAGKRTFAEFVNSAQAEVSQRDTNLRRLSEQVAVDQARIQELQAQEVVKDNRIEELEYQEVQKKAEIKQLEADLAACQAK